MRLIYLGELAGTLPFSTLLIDGRAYDAWAQQIAAGQWLGTEVFYQSPLYPYLLAIVYAVLGHSLTIVRVMQAVFGAVSCVLIAQCANRLFGLRAGWFAGLMLAVYPAAIFFDGLVQKAALDLLLVSTLLWLMVEAQHRRTWPWLAAAGVTLAALTLNRENARIAFPLMLAWILLQFSEQPRTKRWAGAGLFTAAMALVLLPVGLRNYYVGGEFLLTTSQVGPNFFIGNHAGANGTYQPLQSGRGDPRYERQDAIRLAEQSVGRSLSPGEVSSFWLRRSADYIFSQPLDWMKLLAWKSLLTIHAIELVDSESIDLYAEYSLVLRWLYRLWHFGILMPLAVWGAWVTRQHWRELWVFYGLFVLLAASTVLFFVVARYRYPLVPVAILFASAGLARLPEWMPVIGRPGKARLWLPGALVVGIVAVMCNWPMQTLRDVARNYSNLGGGLLDDGRYDEALMANDLAIQRQPLFADAYYNKAVVLDALQRRDEALPLYERALELNPSMGEAHSRLARYHIDHRNFAKARYHLDHAIPLVSNPASHHLEYGLLLDGQGDVEGAIAHYRTAVSLDSHLVMAANNLAWLLATDARPEIRSGAEAVALAESNIREILQDPAKMSSQDQAIGLLDTLAAAYAAVGRFADAVDAVQTALSQAEQAGAPVLVESLKSRLELYAASKPYYRPSAH
ncbi:MAG: tetratricopeptide repeat protein [Pirellulaceae bacterium]|nr:tetratricopeptide repeat protein [Pirellulaceae bacterium]